MTRAASGISRIFCQSCRGSGGGFILYVHMNVIGSLAPVLPWQLGCCVRLNRRILLPPFGGVVEWLMAPVLKTGRAQALVGSNPTPSAEIIWTRRSAPLHQVQISCVPDSFSLRFRGIKCGV